MLLLRDYTYAFGSSLKNWFILLFSLFSLIFIGTTVIFGTINESHCTILTNFYISYSQQKNFSFNKISGSQIQARLCNLSGTCKCCYLIFFFFFLVNELYTCSYIMFLYEKRNTQLSYQYNQDP